MERLPDEVLLLVLERLGARDLLRAARVCRRWAALVPRRALQPRTARDAHYAHAGTRVLLVTARLDPLPALLAAAALRHLAVHAAAPLGARHLAALQQLPHLEHLDVFWAGRVLPHAALPVLRRLRELVLNDPPQPGVLRALAAHCRLRALHMYGRAFHCRPRELVALLAARRDHLRELTLRCPEFGDATYAAVGACAELTTLRLYSCWMLTSKSAAHVTRPPRLRRLHVTGARMLRPRALAELLRRLPPRLEQLALSASWFGDDHAALLAQQAPELHALELWRCRVSARGVVQLAAALPALRELDVDVALGADELAALGAHPALARLRALEAAAAGRLCVRGARAGWARRYARGDGEGPAADLFYYWTRGLQLPPRRAPYGPCVEDDRDCDCDDITLLDIT